MKEQTPLEHVLELTRIVWVRQTLIWGGLILLTALVFNTGMIIVQGNLVPFSEGNSEPHEYSEFALKVGATGETVYKSVPEGALKGAADIAPALARELLSTTYPDPKTATEAAMGEGAELHGNPAFAHAVKLCTHKDGVVSNQTGGGRHLTFFEQHANGRHYTHTFHQILTQNGYQTTDRFDYSVSRSYCGCG